MIWGENMKENSNLGYDDKDIKISENKKSVNTNSLLKLDFKSLKKKVSKGLKKSNRADTPADKKRKVIAFDMGSNTIKIIEAMYYKDKLTIYKWVKIPTPQDAIVDGEIKKEEELYSKLKRALNKNNMNAKYGICTTNSTLIINREIQIPKVEDEEIETVVKYEIQQYLPINLEDYILKSIFLGEEEVDGVEKINIRVVAYPEKIAIGYYNLLMKLGLKPYALDVNYNAVNKFINTAVKNNEVYNEIKDTVTFVDMGARFIDVNIYKDGYVHFTRIIKNGGNDIDEILLESGMNNSGELLEYKSKSIDLYKDFEPLNIKVREITDDWIEKIEKIIQFYKNKKAGNDVNNVIIFGGASKLNGIEAYMTEKLGIMTQIRDISKIAFKLNDNDCDDYINAIGSVIRLGYMRDVNFFSYYLGRKKQVKNSKLYIYGVTAVALSIIGATFGINTGRLYLLDKNIVSYNDKLTTSEIQTKFKEAESINKQIELLKQYDLSLSDISKAIKYRDNVSEKLLKDINSTLPNQISVKNLDIVENTIALKGTSTDRLGIAELKHNLSKLASMQDVYVNSIDAQGALGGGYSFDMKCVLKEGE